MDYNNYISLIVEKLKPIKPYKIILFGSYAYSKPDKDSDIDLIVVTNDEFMPKSFKENSQVYLFVCKYLREIRKNVPIDLIVYTRPMYKKFIELGSMFSKEISLNGKVLYEKNN